MGPGKAAGNGVTYSKDISIDYKEATEASN